MDGYNGYSHIRTTAVNACTYFIGGSSAKHVQTL